MNIVYGFNNNDIVNEIEKTIKTNEKNSRIVCNTKLDVFYEIMNNNVDCVVLMEENSGTKNWTAYEMARLADFKDVHIVVIIKQKHIGTEFVKILYAAGITSAVVENSNLSDVAYLIQNPRSREEALEYYKLVDVNDPEKHYLNLKTVDNDFIEELEGIFCSNLSNSDKIKAIDDKCQGLSQKQFENLMKKRISPAKKEVIRKTKTYKAFNSKTKENHVDNVPASFKKLNAHGERIHILYAFSSSKLMTYIDDELTGMGYEVYSNSEYSKKGILNYVGKYPDVDTIVTVEHLEMQGPYTAHEVGEITKKCNANVIISVDAEHRGEDYMEQLYCEGVTSAFLGNPKTQQIIDMIVYKRSRYEARRCYGIEQGHDDRFVFSNEIKKQAVMYLENGRGDFEKRFDFLTLLFGKSCINEIIQLSSVDVKEKATELGLINNKKKGLLSMPIFGGGKENKNKEPINKNKIESRGDDTKNPETVAGDVIEKDVAKDVAIPLKKEQKKEEQNVQAKRKRGEEIVPVPASEKYDISDIKKKKEQIKSAEDKKNEVPATDREKPVKKVHVVELPKDDVVKQSSKENKRKETDSGLNNEKEKDKSFKFAKWQMSAVVCAIMVLLLLISGIRLYLIKDNNTSVNGNDLVASDNVENDDFYKDIPTESMTEPETTVEETSVVEPTTIEETTVEKITTKKVKKKKKKKKQKPHKQINTVAVVENTTTKAVKKEKIKPKTKALGSYGESNALSASKVNILRSSVGCSGSYSSELSSLAKYMASRGLSDASGTYKSLTNANKSLHAKTWSISIASDTSKDMQKAARKIGSVSGSKYGVGVSSQRGKTGYKIYIVAVYQ